MGQARSMFSYPVSEYTAAFTEAVEKGIFVIPVNGNTGQARNRRSRLYGFRRAYERRAEETRDETMLARVRDFQNIGIYVRTRPDGQVEIVMEPQNADPLAREIRKILPGCGIPAADEEPERMEDILASLGLTDDTAQPVKGIACESGETTDGGTSDGNGT